MKYGINIFKLKLVNIDTSRTENIQKYEEVNLETIEKFRQEFLEIEHYQDVDENPMIDILLQNILKILKKCLLSTNKSLFSTAVEQLINLSNTYGRSLNRHVPQILELINKKYMIYISKIRELCKVLIENGGDSVSNFISNTYPHLII